MIEATFEPKVDIFLVTGTTPLSESVLRMSVLGQVIFPGLRKLLGYFGERKPVS